MRAFRLAFVLLPALVCLVATQPRADETPSVAGVAAELASGQRTVRIVAFGDSITGVYYHTGGRRAWATRCSASPWRRLIRRPRSR